MGSMTTATNTPNTVIRVTNFTRAYGSNGISWVTGMRKKPTLKDAIAVDSISFHVQEGEVYGLLGTNGAGKTSTLEVLEGLANATGGTVRIFDKDPKKDRQTLRPHMGIMLQQGGLPQELTVKETMEMWSGTCSTPRPYAEVLSEVELEHRLNNKVGSLSGGEQRRLDLACALLNDPHLIFLDEPTTGLDPESRRNTWRLLRHLKSRGVTMVLTTHYLEEAEELCDRIAIMHRGRIEVEGTLSELVSTVPSSIVFDATSRTPQLPQLPGTSIEVDGNHVHIRTDQLQAHTFEVLRWANEGGVELKNFAARPASLETLFLRIAGDK